MEQDNQTVYQNIGVVFGSGFGNVLEQHVHQATPQQTASNQQTASSQSSVANPAQQATTAVQSVELESVGGDSFSQSSNVEHYQPSTVRLSQVKGKRIDFIRVMNVLCELDFFTNLKGEHVSKKEVFTQMGKALNIDLSNYDKDLSRTRGEGTSRDSQLGIFTRMRRKQGEMFDGR